MKKLLFSFFMLSALAGYSTHNMAGSFTYRYAGSLANPYQYEIVITTYTKWVGTGGTDKCELYVHFGDGDTAIVPRVNGLSTNCPATADGELISYCGSGDMRMNIYTTTHNFGGPGNYIMTLVDPNRSSGLCNVPDSDNTLFSMTAELIISPFFGNNIAPSYHNAVPSICVLTGTLSHYDPIVTDAEGDSLFYELVTPPDAAGYTLPASSSSFTINSTTGLVTWDTPTMICDYIFDIRVSEYRKIGGAYYLIGKTMEEVWAEVNTVGGVEDETNAVSVNLFPNPSNGEINLEIKNRMAGETYNLVISNSLGQTIKTMTLNGSSEKVFNTDLPAGIYFYSLLGDNNSAGKGKFVISEGIVK